MSADRWQVVVVGAGPAGSTAAALLARRGHRVLLLERTHFPRPKACAEYLSPGVVEEIGRHFPDGDILAGSKSVAGMEVIAGTQRLRLRYRRNGSFVPARTLTRLELDRRIVESAVASGVRLREGFTVTDPIVENGIVVGVHGHSKDAMESMRADLTIVADGCRSRLASSLGLSRRARWPVRLGLMAHYEGPVALSDEFGQMHVEDRGYCGVAPLPSGLVNVAIVSRAGAVRNAGVAVSSFFESWIARNAVLRSLLADSRRVTRVRGYCPLGARAGRASLPGILLVGDAAGFFDPFTGEGIYRAIRGASLAADAAHQVLTAGGASPRELGIYDEMRRMEFRRKEIVTAIVQAFVQYPTLMRYALPRLNARQQAGETLGAVLGDVRHAREFLNPHMLWTAMRP